MTTIIYTDLQKTKTNVWEISVKKSSILSMLAAPLVALWKGTRKSRYGINSVVNQPKNG